MMIEKLKIVFFVAYFLLAPLAGYWIGERITHERWHSFMESYINRQIASYIDNGVILIPPGAWEISGDKSTSYRGYPYGEPIFIITKGGYEYK